MIGDVTRWAPILLALLLATAPVAAQQPVTDSAAADVQGYAPSAEPEPAPSAPRSDAAAFSSASVRTIVLPTRSDAAVGQGIRVADQARDRADADIARLTDRKAKTEALIQAQTREAAELESKRRQADKEKRKGDKAAFEIQKKAVLRQKALAEQLKSLNAAEIDAARKAREAAIAKQRALELERLLMAKRAERSALVPDLEKETLLAQKRASGLERDLAGTRDFVASKRLDLYRAYRESSSHEQ